jgi:hypothetical protein
MARSKLGATPFRMTEDQLAMLRAATEDDVETVLGYCCAPEPRSAAELLEFFNCMLDRLVGEPED